VRRRPDRAVDLSGSSLGRPRRRGRLSSLARLTVAGYGVHIADQVGLVATPLVAAVVFQAPATMIGTLVAFQSLPHLVGSLPSGLLVDRFQPERVAMAATAFSTMGFVLVAVSVSMGWVGWFAVLILLSGLGVVVFVLAALSLIPRIVTVSRFAVSNARIELPRAIAGVVAPLLVGLLVSMDSPELIFLTAGSASAIAFGSLATVTRSDTRTDTRHRPRGSLKPAFQMIVGQGLLRPIALTAVLWNVAFSVLIVAAVPYLTDYLATGSEVFGVAMSLFGVGAVAGTWVMRAAGDRIEPRLVLLFGPASSMSASAALWAFGSASSDAIVLLSFFVLGFGPSMWLVAQNTIRQTVTPNQMLGSVNAVMQTCIYGSRPAGATLGGLLLGGAGPRICLVFVSALFVASFATAAISDLRNVGSYESVSSQQPET
jgi:predicted MFS family arabinose efflux permease